MQALSAEGLAPKRIGELVPDDGERVKMRGKVAW